MVRMSQFLTREIICRLIQRERIVFGLRRNCFTALPSFVETARYFCLNNPEKLDIFLFLALQGVPFDPFIARGRGKRPKMRISWAESFSLAGQPSLKLRTIRASMHLLRSLNEKTRDSSEQTGNFGSNEAGFKIQPSNMLFGWKSNYIFFK